MAFAHSKDSVFEFNSVDVSQYLTGAGAQLSGDPAEITALGDQSKAFIPGFQEGTIPIEGAFEPTAHSTFSAAFNTEVPWAYYPAGNVMGLPEITGNGILVSYEVNSEVGDLVSISGEIQMTGDVTFGTV
jgi:hypothetical protein